MSGFLAAMERASRARVVEAAAREPVAALRRRIAGLAPPPPIRLEQPFELIAEYKRVSPALGRLAGPGDSLARRVEGYARGGAVAVSVVTEPTRFGGSLAALGEAAAILGPLGVPALRKDFLVDPYQLHEARAAGAGGVLLIVRLLPGDSLGELVDCAVGLGLFVLLESFDEADVARAVPEARRARIASPSARLLLGVNCRDLGTLEVLPFRLRELVPLLPAELPRVAESGIAAPAGCADLAAAGYSAALVGGSLMRAADPVAAVRDLVAAGRAAARAAA